MVRLWPDPCPLCLVRPVPAQKNLLMWGSCAQKVSLSPLVLLISSCLRPGAELDRGLYWVPRKGGPQMWVRPGPRVTGLGSVTLPREGGSGDDPAYLAGGFTQRQFDTLNNQCVGHLAGARLCAKHFTGHILSFNLVLTAAPWESTPAFSFHRRRNWAVERAGTSIKVTQPRCG